MGIFNRGGNWWIDFYHQGKRMRRKVGPSKKLAELALADIQVKQAKNEFLGICEPKRIQFKDFAVEYLDYSRVNKGKGTYKNDVWVIHRLIPVWGSEYMYRITPKMIEDYKSGRAQRVKPATVNRDLQTVKALFNKAVAWDYLNTNPAKPVKRMRLNKGMERFLSQEEADLLLRACRRSQNSHLYAIVCVALHTGLRRGEILRLQWPDVDFKAGKLHVVSREEGPTKTRESRSVPMNRTVSDVLKRHPRRLDTPYVFVSSEGKPFLSVHYGFCGAVQRAGINHVRFHDLRHTFASQLVMAGVDIRTVQELLGHKDIKMTMRYAHLAPDHMKRAVEILDGHYLDTKEFLQENVDCGIKT